MIILILNCLTIFVLLVLSIFSLRRFLFALTAVFTRIDCETIIPEAFRPFVTILVPCHNEETVIAETLDALLKMDYPRDKLEIVVIDDLSSDHTLKIAQRYEKEYSHIHAFQRSKSALARGKAAAMNEALTKFTKGEIVYFVDADHRVRPDALIRLVGHFSNREIGAVSGRCRPWNKYDAIISSYVYLESLIHHRVTMYASDKLGLAPCILGSNFCIRRALLDRIGRFNEKSLTEDMDLTASVYEHSYIVKYDVTSISEHEAPHNVRSYMLQHLRWNRGFNQTVRTHWRRILRDKSMPLPRRIEETLVSLGYLDRLFFITGFVLTLLSLFIMPSYRFPYWVWPIFLGLPLFQILIALILERERMNIYLRLPLILSMFSVDILVSLTALYQDITQKPTRWYKTLRIGDRATTEKEDLITQGRK